MRLDNPFIIDASGKINHTVFDLDYSYNDALEEVAADHGIEVSELEAEIEDFEDEIYEYVDRAHGDLHEKKLPRE